MWFSTYFHSVFTPLLRYKRFISLLKERRTGKQQLLLTLSDKTGKNIASSLSTRRVVCLLNAMLLVLVLVLFDWLTKGTEGAEREGFFFTAGPLGSGGIRPPWLEHWLTDLLTNWSTEWCWMKAWLRDWRKDFLSLYRLCLYRVGLNHLEEQNSSTDWLTCLLEPYCFYYHWNRIRTLLDSFLPPEAPAAGPGMSVLWSYIR